MDQSALISLNALLGNDTRAAGIEWALTGGQIQFQLSATIAVGGADADARLGSMPVEPYRAYHAMPGDVLNIESIRDGRFLYVCVAGGIDCEPVMWSRSTYVPGGFGGIGGRRLKTGDVLPVVAMKERKRPQVSDPLPQSLRAPFRAEVIRYIPRNVDDVSLALAGSYSVAEASDRTGYRLAGQPSSNGASVTSEPVCPGVIQLPPGGEPIVLMADAPTIGGYRIAGAVIGVDLGILAQRLPGEAVTLEPTTVQRAQREIAARAEVIDRIREWALQ